MWKQAATIKCTDIDESDEAWVFVRYDDISVAIGLCLKSNGDMEVLMNKKDAKRVMDALKTAIE